MNFDDKMQASGNEVDQRLFAIFKIRDNKCTPAMKEVEVVQPTYGAMLLEDISDPITIDSNMDELARRQR